METNELPKNIRRILVEEIERCNNEGRIPNSLAKSLRKLYDFDFAPPPPVEAVPVPKPVQPIPALVEELVQPKPVPAPTPRPTLAQTLLSETSIRIALYLGAFFVIAAALILAALVENLRLPVLLTVTVLFAAGALALKRRLPQPSFILYLVFSVLLPISAWVLAELRELAGRPLTLYWLGVLAGMALIWAFSTRLYASRFFSLAALLALDAALWLAGSLLDRPPLILFLLLLTISSLAGLGGATLLKSWKGQRMAMPVFILAQVQQGLILLAALYLLIDAIMTYHGWEFVINSLEWGFVPALTWLLTGVFVILSNLLFPGFQYPWLAALALMPVPWLAIVRPANDEALILSAWGAILTIGGTFLASARERWRQYALPASTAGTLLMLLGSAIGLANERWLGFGLFLGTAILLTALHILHNRIWIWVLALGSGLAAYFTLFQLPFAQSIAVYVPAQLAGTTVLLLLPDMLLPSRRAVTGWRGPLRAWAILTGMLALLAGTFYTFSFHALSGLLNISSFEISYYRVAFITLGILGFLYLAYAIRMQRTWVGVLFCLHFTLAMMFGVVQYEVRWFPILVGLAVLFYGCGILLRSRGLLSWSGVFRASGLVLGGILALFAISFPGYFAGQERAFYMFVLACLFLVEVYWAHWLETVPPLLYSIAFVMALSHGNVNPLPLYAAGIAGIFLGLDLLYRLLQMLSQERRPARWLTRGIGGLAALLTPVLVIFPYSELVAGAWVCAGLAVLFVVQVLIYHKERLGYAAAVFLVLAVLFTDLHFYAGRWLWAMIITAVVFYRASFLLVPLKQPGWETVMRWSGLGLASLTALSAPWEHSGKIASLPVVIAASLWAWEAWRKRDVWLAFPANGLYLMAYFMLLSTYRVGQTQFYSIGAAVLGMLMHYLLVRAGSRTGAFLMGMLSQLVFIGTSYIQFVSTENIWYFVVMFVQSLAVLVYGIVLRSRSLVITPILLVILGVVTVVFGALRGMSTVIMIGCTGIGLILLGIGALLMRERIAGLRSQLKGWRA